MTYKEANEMFPVWASDEAVRIVDEPTEKEPLPLKHRLTDRQERFVKRYAFAIGFILAMAVYTALVGIITGSIVKHNLTQEYEHQYRARVQAYLDEQEQQRMASNLVTGEASRQAGMDLEAREIARVLYGVKDNSESDLRTAVWCILNRVDNSAYPANIYQVCSQSQQWMGYSSDNPVLDDLYKIAHEELETWYSGTRPVDSSFVYLHWRPTKITLRNGWDLYGDNTQTWSWGK